MFVSLNVAPVPMHHGASSIRWLIEKVCIEFIILCILQTFF